MSDPSDTPSAEASARKRERSNRPFPSASYEEAEAFAQQVFDFASGNPARRLLLFNHINKSPESSASRDLITNSSKYGLTKGSYKAVQISRISDKVPFDINQMRTVIIDNTDIYSLLPKLELYKSEIANQTRKALEEADSYDNPISIYYPTLEVTVPS